MAPKEILVHLDGQPNCAARYELALTLARQNSGRAVALYALELPKERPTSLTLVDAVYGVSDRLSDPDREAYVRERDAAFDNAAHLEAAFMRAAKRAGVSARWETCPEKPKDLIGLITQRAWYADLLILSQADPSLPSPDGLAKLPEAVMLACGRPVVILPHAAQPHSLGKNILVAWNETREAARAIADALWLLKTADKVTVLSVGGEAGGEAPAQKLVRLLLDHEVRAEAVQADPHDGPIGELILSQAAEWGCDLIVMGGYGHSPTRELILGGATRGVLQHMTIPVLMSH